MFGLEGNLNQIVTFTFLIESLASTIRFALTQKLDIMQD